MRSLEPLLTFGFERSPAGSLVRSGSLWDPKGGPIPTAPELEPHVEKHHRDQALLDRLRDGHVPTDADLADAPTIDHWIPILFDDGDAVLLGASTNHPTLSNEGLMHTSSLFAMDGDGRWARTRSRWYRLGPPAEIT